MPINVHHQLVTPASLDSDILQVVRALHARIVELEMAVRALESREKNRDAGGS